MNATRTLTLSSSHARDAWIVVNNQSPLIVFILRSTSQRRYTWSDGQLVLAVCPSEGTRKSNTKHPYPFNCPGVTSAVFKLNDSSVVCIDNRAHHLLTWRLHWYTEVSRVRNKKTMKTPLSLQLPFFLRGSLQKGRYLKTHTKSTNCNGAH